MTLKKSAQWLIMFSVLTAFTVTATQGLDTGAPVKAYAQAIEHDAAFQNSKYLVARDGLPDPGAIKSTAIANVIQRFVRLLKRNEELCSVTEQQFARLRSELDVETTEVHVGDDTYVMVHLPSHDVDGQALNFILGTDPSNVHCTLVEVYQRVILHLSAHLS